MPGLHSVTGHEHVHMMSSMCSDNYKNLQLVEKSSFHMLAPCPDSLITSYCQGMLSLTCYNAAANQLQDLQLLLTSPLLLLASN